MITPTMGTVWAVYRDCNALDEGLSEWWAELVVGWDQDGTAYVVGFKAKMESCAESDYLQMLVPDISKRTKTPAVQRAIAEAGGELPEDS